MRDHEQLLGVERDIERLSPPFIEDATRARPPLRLVRGNLGIVTPAPATRRGRRRDGVAFGFVLVALLLGGAVAMSITFGWLR